MLDFLFKLVITGLGIVILLSIVLAIVVVVIIVRVIRRFLEKKRPEISSFTQWNHTMGEIRRLRRSNVWGDSHFDNVMGRTEACIRSAKDKAALGEETLTRLFEKGSITYDKFASALGVLNDTVRGNTHIILTAAKLYVGVRRDTHAGQGLGDGRDAPLPLAGQRSAARTGEDESERRQLIEVQRKRMDEALEQNEALLLKTDTLISNLQDVGESNRADELLEELTRLAKEARYYKRSIGG